VIESRLVRLKDLFSQVEGCRVVGDPYTPISALSYRSSQVGPGHLFFCVPGFVRDGHEFAQEAVARGGSALCVERVLAVDCPQVAVPSVREAMGEAASAFFGRPSARMSTVGITGTNGKTTSAYLTAFLLDRAGIPSGLVGTVETRIGGIGSPAERTTPEAVDTQRDLARMVEAGDRAAVMEVSSHALDLGRANGITFAAVAFTNLTQDHLDYHGTLEQYFKAKCRLFIDPAFTRGLPVAVVNVDDPFGKRLVLELDPRRVLTFSLESEADLQAGDMVLEPAGTSATLTLRDRALARAMDAGSAAPADGEQLRLPVVSPLLGRFNVANLLTAVGLGLGLGLNVEDMLRVLPDFPGVPGRMERVDAGQPFTVLVDYAHSPDGVENALRAARAVAPQRVIALVGCGGDRDRDKRPKMGRAAEQGSDLAVITSDNPRSEDPVAIIEQILVGLDRPERAVVEPDRRLAIKKAVEAARPGDMVLILGKGHESGQQFRDRTVPFDDRRVTAEVLAQLGFTRAPGTTP
jgi:UDP-N-acetylmuramoyl-L-alanyl-D-glutamate--2,6-diaminopimelate ligase